MIENLLRKWPIVIVLLLVFPVLVYTIWLLLSEPFNHSNTTAYILTVVCAVIAVVLAVAELRGRVNRGFESQKKKEKSAGQK